MQEVGSLVMVDGERERSYGEGKERGESIFPLTSFNPICSQVQC